jgi:hypothetical protein
VRDIELMKPLAAQGEFLGSRLERIAEQGAYGRDSSSERTNAVARAAIRGYLLVIIAADLQRDANRKIVRTTLGPAPQS